MRRSFLLLLLAAFFPLLPGCSRSNALIIGTDATYPPFESKNEQGDLTGVSIDMGRALAAKLGRPVEFRNMNFDGLITALQSGSVDLVISSMSATDDRRKTIDFSDPYVKTGIAVLASSKSDMQSEEDLKTPGRKIVVRLGTTGESYTRQYLPKAAITVLDSDSACVLEVVKGGVDAWIYDQVSLMRFHERHPAETRVFLKPLREEVWAIGLRKGNEALKGQINDFLKDFRAKGGFKELAQKYLQDERTMMEAANIPFLFDL